MNDRGSGDDDELDAATVGAAIRGRRRTAGMTLDQLAGRAGFSKSLISQIEAGRTWPSLGALKRIGAVLDVPMSELLGPFDGEATGPPGSHGPPRKDAGTASVVRRGARKSLRYTGTGPEAELLTPDLQRALEVTTTQIAPGPAHALVREAHDGDVFALIRAGSGTLQVGERTCALAEGDSIHFPGCQPHRFEAHEGQPVSAVWVISPPAF